MKMSGKTVLAMVFAINVLGVYTQVCPGGQQLISSGGLSAADRQSIVDAHNRLRQSVALGRVQQQPPAANMMEMNWDDELAATAQSWADQCSAAHDRQNQRDVGRFPVGQNIAATWTTRSPSSPADYRPDFLKQIHAWFAEVQTYGFKPASGYGHGTGHYSQLVWGETSHVGCGFTFYYDASKGYTKLYVCNYGPGGNVVGSKPYERGSPSCSSFGLSDSPKYNGLCSVGFGSSYNSLANSYGSNIIPDTSNYNSFAYGSNSFSSGNANLYGGYSQESYDNGYQYSSYSTPRSAPPAPIQPSTYKPFVSLFGGASSLLDSPKPKQNIFGNSHFFTPKRNGFQFGTFFL